MSTMSIEWHEKTILTSRENYQRELDLLEGRRNDLMRWEARNISWQMQIDEAKKRSLTQFDSEKFLKLQVKRVTTQATE